MRDSANDAFFTAESLENLSEALVREAIQNSLDAAERTEAAVREVRVRICLVPRATGDAKTMLQSLFDGAQEHFETGIEPGVRSSALQAPPGYLVFEDFGTTGLNGDVTAWRLDDSMGNAFWSFFRAEGRSSKSGDSLGRWGIGKQVFPTASSVSAMFGVTVRNDEPARVLMGSAVIHSRVVDDKDYDPDGWFGFKEGADQPVLPVTNAAFIDRFVSAFDLKRGKKKGLSILVPWVDERVNTDDLRRGIVRNFFWPILQGELVVELETGDGKWELNHESLALHRALLPVGEAAVLEFAAWAAFVPAENIIKLPVDAAMRPDWRSTGDNLLTDAIVADIQTRLSTEQRVAIEIPVRVRPKDPAAGGERLSRFHVFFTPCRDNGHRTIFLRDGIVITDIRAPLLSGSRSLVVVDDRPLAGLLGDAEGVNHTQWQKDSPKFHNRYVYGADTIKFVTRSVYEIVQRIHSAEKKGDPTLLLDLFFLPTEEGEPEKRKKAISENNGELNEPPGGAERKPRRFDIRKAEDGFKLVAGETPPDKFPVRVRIEAGYAVRRGNPIKRWAQDDFQFIRSPLRLDPKPVGVSWQENGNSLELEIRQADFVFGVSGFDRRRDLVVRAVELKQSDETDI
jgi:hypothetical protein